MLVQPSSPAPPPWRLRTPPGLACARSRRSTAKTFGVPFSAAPSSFSAGLLPRNQHHGLRRALRLCAGVDAALHIGDLARVDRQDLAAFAARHALQGLIEGIDRSHRRLPPRAWSQFEQKIIPAGEWLVTSTAG